MAPSRSPRSRFALPRLKKLSGVESEASSRAATTNPRMQDAAKAWRRSVGPTYTSPLGDGRRRHSESSPTPSLGACDLGDKLKMVMRAERSDAVRACQGERAGGR